MFVFSKTEYLFLRFKINGNLKKNLVEFLELKKKVSQIKTVLHGFHSIVGATEERISGVKVRAVETLQMEKKNAMVL